MKSPKWLGKFRFSITVKNSNLPKNGSIVVNENKWSKK